MSEVDASLQPPVAAERLLPHASPMLLVEQLISYSPGRAEVRAVAKQDGLFSRADGTVEITALAELVAQSCAALNGYEDIINGRPIRRGFLVGCQNFSVERALLVGEQALVAVELDAAFEEFSVMNGVISVAGRQIAAGSVKLWLPKE